MSGSLYGQPALPADAYSAASLDAASPAKRKTIDSSGIFVVQTIAMPAKKVCQLLLNVRRKSKFSEVPHFLGPEITSTPHYLV
jgi:hypothetical protein